jgi:hypothetical protein
MAPGTDDSHVRELPSFARPVMKLIGQGVRQLGQFTSAVSVWSSVMLGA